MLHIGSLRGSPAGRRKSPIFNVAMVYYRQRRMPTGFGFLPPTPPGIKKLLWINAGIWLVFALSHAAGMRPLMLLFRWLSLTPADVIRGAVWQPLTYMFLHDPSGLWHVGLNLFALWMFGGTLERDWGTRRFLNFYLICGAGAGLVDVVLRLAMGTSAVATVGASGAVLSVVTAFAVMYPHTPILISFVLPVPAWIVAAAYAAINLLGAVSDFSRGGNPNNTAFTVHLAGMALGYYFVKRRPKLLDIDWQSTYRHWLLRRSRRKFEVYMKKRKRSEENGPWVN